MTQDAVAQVLPRNHPRFCAKYIRKVGTVQSKSRYWPENLLVGSEKFAALRSAQHDFKVGDRMYILRREPSLRGWPSSWTIHEIELPEAYWRYKSWMEFTPKMKRTHPYKAYAQAWFGSNARLIERL